MLIISNIFRVGCLLQKVHWTSIWGLTKKSPLSTAKTAEKHFRVTVAWRGTWNFTLQASRIAALSARGPTKRKLLGKNTSPRILRYRRSVWFIHSFKLHFPSIWGMFHWTKWFSHHLNKYPSNAIIFLFSPHPSSPSVFTILNWSPSNCSIPLMPSCFPRSTNCSKFPFTPGLTLWN